MVGGTESKPDARWCGTRELATSGDPIRLLCYLLRVPLGFELEISAVALRVDMGGNVSPFGNRVREMSQNTIAGLRPSKRIERHSPHR